MQETGTTAEAIGRIACIKTGEDIGLLYRWDNGVLQAALYHGSVSETLNCDSESREPAFGVECDERQV